MPDTNAAYYCSKECMNEVKRDLLLSFEEGGNIHSTASEREPQRMPSAEQIMREVTFASVPDRHKMRDYIADQQGAIKNLCNVMENLLAHTEHKGDAAKLLAVGKSEIVLAKYKPEGK